MLTILIAFMITLFLTACIALADQAVELALNPAPIVKVLGDLSMLAYNHNCFSLESLIDKVLTATIGREALILHLEQSVGGILVKPAKTSGEAKPISHPVAPIKTGKQPTYYVDQLFGNDQIAFSY